MRVLIVDTILEHVQSIFHQQDFPTQPSLLMQTAFVRLIS